MKILAVLFVVVVMAVIYVFRRVPKNPEDWAYFDDGDGMPTKKKVQK